MAVNLSICTISQLYINTNFLHADMVFVKRNSMPKYVRTMKRESISSDLAIVCFSLVIVMFCRFNLPRDQ